MFVVGIHRPPGRCVLYLPACMGLLPTPKQPQPERLKDWYPYYAGFTAGFAHAVLNEFFASAETLLDPWNGSGTTTAVGAVRGIVCTGIDINPAMTVIAKARLTPITVRESLVPIAREILQAGDVVRLPAWDRDPLGQLTSDRYIAVRP